MIRNHPSSRQLVIHYNPLSLPNWIVDNAVIRSGGYVEQLNLDIAITTNMLGFVAATGAYSAARSMHVFITEDPFSDDPEGSIARSMLGSLLQQNGFTVSPIYVFARPLRNLATDIETRIDQFARVITHELFHTVSAVIHHDNRRGNIMHEDVRLGGWEIDPLLVRILQQQVGRRSL